MSIKRVKGFINPRYLDPKWFNNFTISRFRKGDKDIDVIVEFCHTKYESYQSDNDLETYGELVEKLRIMQSNLDVLRKEYQIMEALYGNEHEWQKEVTKENVRLKEGINYYAQKRGGQTVVNEDAEAVIEEGKKFPSYYFGKLARKIKQELKF